MILPTKHVSSKHSLIGAGAVILKNLDAPKTITSLWESVRSFPEVAVYWRFVLALDFLFAIGAVDLIDGLIARKEP